MQTLLSRGYMYTSSTLVYSHREGDQQSITAVKVADRNHTFCLRKSSRLITHIHKRTHLFSLTFI